MIFSSASRWLSSIYQLWSTLTTHEPAMIPDKTRLLSAKAFWSARETAAYDTLKHEIHFEVTEQGRDGFVVVNPIQSRSKAAADEVMVSIDLKPAA